MRFTMYSDFDEYGEVGADDVIAALQELKDGDLDFIVLEAGTPVAHNAYIQTAHSDVNNHDGTFTLETRFIYDDESYKHYIKEVIDIEEVEEAFMDYIKGNIPDINHGWAILEI